MTDEIAFQLGQFDFPHFYSLARWKLNKEPFPLAAFFEWSLPGGLGGWPCKKEGEEYVTDWENIVAHGRVLFGKFETTSQKLAYIRGRLSSYSVDVSSDRIYVCWANSYDFRDFFARSLEEVIRDRFILEPADESGGRRFRMNAPRYSIVKSETVGTIPGTPAVTLEADPEIIAYIVGDEKLS